MNYWGWGSSPSLRYYLTTTGIPQQPQQARHRLTSQFLSGFREVLGIYKRYGFWLDLRKDQYPTEFENLRRPWPRQEN